MIECKTCEGMGMILLITPYREGNFPCPICNANGTMDDEYEARLERGKAHRHIRLEAGLSLRKCAETYNIDMTTLSEYEGGKLLPDFVPPFIEKVLEMEGPNG